MNVNLITDESLFKKCDESAHSFKMSVVIFIFSLPKELLCAEIKNKKRKPKLPLLVFHFNALMALLLQAFLHLQIQGYLMHGAVVHDLTVPPISQPQSLPMSYRPS